MQSAFQSAHVDARLLQLKLIDAQRDRFAHPQAMPVHEQDQERIALTVSRASRRADELVHLAVAEEVLASLVRINRIG